MTPPTFEKMQAAMASAAADGVAAAGLALVQTLGAAGETAAVSSAPDGAAVSIEGPGVVAREFGTRQRPAQPFLAPALQASRAGITALIGQKIGEALRGRR